MFWEIRKEGWSETMWENVSKGKNNKVAQKKGGKHDEAEGREEKNVWKREREKKGDRVFPKETIVFG